MKYSKIVKKECPMCGKTHFVKLTEVEYDQYKKYIAYGSLIQNALSNTSPTVREFLKTGYCPECQELLFGESEQKELFFSYNDIREDIIKEFCERHENILNALTSDDADVLTEEEWPLLMYEF